MRPALSGVPTIVPSRMHWGWALLVAGCARTETASEPAWQPQEVDAQISVAPGLELGPIARQGGALVRGGDRLYLADEDRSMLRVLDLPATMAGEYAEQLEIPMPGRPASVLVVADRVLVTIRDPGLVLALETKDDGDLVEVGRVAVPDDAWGITVTPDGRTALVTSAWTHAVSAIDVATMALRWTVPVAREPRGVVVMADGDTAYVTHLVGSALTRIDGLDSPQLVQVALAAAPLRNPGDAFAAERAEAASLGYAAVLSPDGSRLFVPRHALGATGKLAWAGQPTVDVLLTADETPLAEAPEGHTPLSRYDVPLAKRDVAVNGPGPLQRRPVFAQPRAAVYRARTRTLLVASEGRDALVELDAESIDPSAHELERYDLSPGEDETRRDVPGATICGAPTGIALSADEATAWVFCRATATLAVVALDDFAEPKPAGRVLARLPLASEGADAELALGRRLFFDASDNDMSLGVGCAGCHPDGRDDGHVWHELGSGVYRAFPEHQVWVDVHAKGEARQTPMLAGRVDAEGPYGWRGESPTLEQRILHGFTLHHWWPAGWGLDHRSVPRMQALARYLREGLVPPPENRRELDDVELRGKELFEDETVGCAGCHAPASDYTDRQRVELDLRAPSPAYVGKERPLYRTPSLRFVAGTEPYLHDGSVATLADLLGSSHDRMGMTSQLDAADRAALTAFLATLGGAAPAPEMPIEIPLPVVHTALPVGPAPTAEEWSGAAPLSLARNARPCRAEQLREWVRVRCAFYASEVAQIGGSSAGVTLSHGEPYVRKPAEWWQSPESVDDAVLVFPVREGDRRVFQLVESDFVRWGGVDLDVGMIVSELWLEGASEPTITVH
jgi:mono/diheme cytochrome c family protein